MPIKSSYTSFYFLIPAQNDKKCFTAYVFIALLWLCTCALQATFESLIEAQETQEVIEKDDDLQECTDIRYLFKEIKLILNPVSINSIKEDHFKFLSSVLRGNNKEKLR